MNRFASLVKQALQTEDNSSAVLTAGDVKTTDYAPGDARIPFIFGVKRGKKKKPLIQRRNIVKQ